MELRPKQAIIISAGIGYWYAQGVKRLRRSLNFVGWPGDELTWGDEYPPDCPPHTEVPYYFKIAAFEAAIREGYTHILWCDASFWAIRSPMDIFDYYINEHGLFMFRSGYSLAQTVNDRTLTALGIARDELVDVPEYASGCVGINLANPNGKAIYHLWKYYMDSGYSIGSRNHDNQSNDPRFLFHRQDQTCLSLAMYKLELTVPDGMDYVAYFNSGYNVDKVIFFINGL